jgi:hypothetical protein
MDVVTERDYLAAVVTSLLNHPSLEFREYMIKVISAENVKIGDNTKKIILNHLEDLGPETPKDDDYRFNYSLNESIKKEFNRFIK